MMRREQSRRPCAWCERVFRPLSKSGKYCTLGCRDAAQRKRIGTGKPLPERACTECSKVFVPHHHLVKICSDDCRLAIQRRKKKAQYYKHRRPAKPRTRRCLICDTPFVAVSHSVSALTCRPECSYLLSRKRTREALAQARAQDPEIMREIDRLTKAGYMQRKRQGTLRPRPQHCKICSAPIADSRNGSTVCSLQCSGRARAYDPRSAR